MSWEVQIQFQGYAGCLAASDRRRKREIRDRGICDREISNREVRGVKASSEAGQRVVGEAHSVTRGLMAS